MDKLFLREVSEEYLQNLTDQAATLTLRISSLWGSAPKEKVSEYLAGGQSPPSNRLGFVILLKLQIEFISLLRQEAIRHGKEAEYNAILSEYPDLNIYSQDEISNEIAVENQKSLVALQRLLG